MKKQGVLIFIGLFFFTTYASAQYAPPVGQSGTTAIHKDSSIFTGWASNCIVTRGLQDISNVALGNATVGSSIDATEKSGINGVVSLGDGGSAILTFNGLITNGPGADFAIFENSFSDSFLELAFVEVSSDGVNFFRFDAVSLTDTAIQTGSFGSTDATKIYNLAGKYRAQYGTPFDLNELTGIAGLDINNITHIKIIDVVGSINPLYASQDYQGRIVNDPWPTAFGSSGFDLDAVGIIHFSSTSINEKTSSINISIYPNPASNKIYFNNIDHDNYQVEIVDLNGKVLSAQKLHKEIDISYLDNGIYFIRIYSEEKNIVHKIVKQ